jgi:hypothetical protein
MFDLNLFIFNSFSNVLMLEIYMICSAIEYRILRHYNYRLIIKKEPLSSLVSLSYLSIFFSTKQVTLWLHLPIYIRLPRMNVTLFCFFDVHKNTPDPRVNVYSDVLFVSFIFPAQSLSQKSDAEFQNFSRNPNEN